MIVHPSMEFANEEERVKFFLDEAKRRDILDTEFDTLVKENKDNPNYIGVVIEDISNMTTDYNVPGGIMDNMLRPDTYNKLSLDAVIIAHDLKNRYTKEQVEIIISHAWNTWDDELFVTLYFNVKEIIEVISEFLETIK